MMGEETTTGHGRPRAILFDWDNTLVDSFGTITAAFNHTLETFGLPTWSAGEARRRIQRSLRDSFPELFGDRWREARTIYYGHFAAHHLDRLRPMPGAETLLERLRGRGARLGVLSNKRGGFLRAEVEALGWECHFDALVGAGDAPRDKPDPVAVESVLTAMGIAPGPDVWFVGDAPIDMECARAAGLTAVLIRDEIGAYDGPAPDIRFVSCETASFLVG